MDARQLVSLKFGTDPLVEEADVATGREVVTAADDNGSTATCGTLVYVVRRPG